VADGVVFTAGACSAGVEALTVGDALTVGVIGTGDVVSTAGAAGTGDGVFTAEATRTGGVPVTVGATGELVTWIVGVAAPAGAALAICTAGIDKGMSVAISMARPARAMRAIGVGLSAARCRGCGFLARASSPETVMRTKGVGDIGGSFMWR